MKTLKVSGLASPHMKRRAAPRTYHMPMVWRRTPARSAISRHNTTNPPFLGRLRSAFLGRIGGFSASVTVSADITPSRENAAIAARNWTDWQDRMEALIAKRLEA